MSPVYRYERITTKRVKRGACPTCGKKVARSKTFMNTVNPFNRNEDGTVCTPEEVWQAVNAQADAWGPDFTCASHVEAERS